MNINNNNKHKHKMEYSTPIMKLPSASFDSTVEAQKLKNDRKMVKLREEIWRQDRKDRRAFMEIIASAELEISNTCSSLATRKIRGWNDSHKQELNDRIRNAKTRIRENRNSIAKLDKRIEDAELELLSSN